MKKILLTGGGTAGHIVPALNVAEKLKNEYIIHYIGSKNGIENEILKNYDYINYHKITTGKLKRSFSFSNFLLPFKVLSGYLESKKLIKEIKPDIVFSKGGYVSVPVVFASKRYKIPVISHESDLSVGLANKIALPKCNIICCSFEETAKKIGKKAIFTGSPINPKIFNGDKKSIIEKYNLKKKFSILVLGGSLGSQTINDCIYKILDKLLTKFNVIHIVGKNNLKNIVKDNYIEIGYTNNIEDFYATSDLVISRAGSNTIFELLALNKPTILIPLQKASRGDQVENAEIFKNKYSFEVINENNINEQNLYEKIHYMYLNRNIVVKNMQKNTINNGLNKIVEIIKNNTK